MMIGTDKVNTNVVFPGLLGASVLTIFGILASRFYATPLALFHPDIHNIHPITLRLILLPSLGILWAAVVFVGWRLTKEPARAVFMFRALPRNTIPLVLVTLVGLQIVLLKFQDFELQLLGRQGVLQAPQDLSFHLGVSVFIAPVFEELLYRGLILRGLLSRYHPMTAVLLTSVLFTVGHGSWIAGPEYLFTGIFLGYWFLLTRSLWVCILAHSTINLVSHHLSCLACGFDLQSAGPHVIPYGKPEFWIALVGLAALSFGFYWARQLMRADAHEEIPTKQYSRNEEIEDLLEEMPRMLKTPNGTSLSDVFGDCDGPRICMYYKYMVDSCLGALTKDEYSRYGSDLTSLTNTVGGLLEQCFDRSPIKRAESQKLWIDCVEGSVDEEYEEVLGWINCLPYEDYRVAIFTRDEIAASLYCGKLFGPWEVSVDTQNTLESLDEKFRALITYVNPKEGGSYPVRCPFYLSKSSHWWYP